MLLEFLTRIGTFFILIGIGIFILFIASNSAGAANFDYLFWAVLSVIVGFFLRRRHEPSSPAERFSVMRKFRRSGPSRKERK
jgi:membrane protein implicated in regulation of membrane protease activity